MEKPAQQPIILDPFTAAQQRLGMSIALECELPIDPYMDVVGFLTAQGEAGLRFLRDAEQGPAELHPDQRIN